MSSVEPKLPANSDALTHLIRLAAEGDEAARSRVFTTLYAELRARAGRIVRRMGSSDGLQPTALVHEMYIKISSGTVGSVADRSHFLLIASRAMRQVLIDHVRAQNAVSRSKPARQVPLDDVIVQFQESVGDLERLDDALASLAKRDEEMVHAIELRFFSGLGVAETADILGIPVRTFERRWQLTKAWLALQVRA